MDLAERVEQMRLRAPRAQRQSIAPPLTPLVFDPAAQGIAQAITAAGDQWATDALAVLRRYLETHEWLHVDDIRPHWPELPEGADARAVGAIITRAKAANWIIDIPVAIPGWTGPPVVAATESTSSRGGLKTLWRSNLYNERTQR